MKIARRKTKQGWLASYIGLTSILVTGVGVAAVVTRSFLTGLLFIVGGASGLTYAYIQRTAE
jgi:hypothetical protein